MQFETYPDRELMQLQLANILAGELAETLRREGKATLAVPGGTTPGPVFDTLSGVDLDWGNVAVVLTDERWVEETSDRSNTRLLRERLLRGKAAAAHLIPMYHPGPSIPEDGVEILEAGLAPHLPISVLLLGMGADMHTASLFPGADRLEEALSATQRLILPMRAEGAGEPRVTLTAPVLRAAVRVHVMITGAEKRAAIERAASLSPEQAPIRAVLDMAVVHWAE
ncbi:6-phosphogluconolactonase [Xinfangfangia sp. CPCC 101601]|uniref:6-phosphogluconolactonase n=1 Tax=Pseudogemmobacter lacusdianii TaxID=3069608 RepID=A0ABU0VXE8_9RHOB|nr:6-phosphogluconolactonase [Xinfangfangia sp. CPCC 101601]MDQ2065580.1 6-phosphogluconolactonase [Xinfangfangia sp. CPCC 101601]